MPRPVDVRVTDREGNGVAGLTGRLFAIRPSDSRLNQTTPLVGLPQEAGSYRSLVRLDEPGAWELRIDTTQCNPEQAADQIIRKLIELGMIETGRAGG